MKRLHELLHEWVDYWYVDGYSIISSCHTHDETDFGNVGVLIVILASLKFLGTIPRWTPISSYDGSIRLEQI